GPRGEGLPHRRRVVVGDGAGDGGGGEGGVGRVGEVESKGLVFLVDGVAVDLHRDDLAGLARREGQGAGGGDVVAAGRRGSVGGGVAHGDGLGVDVGEADGEVEVALPGVALDDGRVGGGDAGRLRRRGRRR